MVTLLAATLFMSGGCRPATQTFFPAEGVLLVNGEPVANACIAFHPVPEGEDARYPVGRTDAAGRFRLSTESGSYGAPSGDYVVTIVWVDESGDECKCAEPLKHDLLQGHYADPKLSGIRVTVRPTDENVYRFHARRLPDRPPL